MLSSNNFIENYLEYYKNTEPPTIYHRWGALTGIAALLGRQAWISHFDTKIFPNLYVMLVGESGTRKGTVVKNIKKFLSQVEYKKFSSNKTTKEKFLLDLEGREEDDEDSDLDVKKNAKNPTMRELFGKELSLEPAEMFIVVDEFNVFLGQGNMDFINILTELWNNDDSFDDRIKNGKSVHIAFPTVNILGGNTDIGISMAFPIEVIGQGFFSRLIMVHSEPTGRKITWPPPPNPEDTAALIKQLWMIRHSFKGEIHVQPAADQAIDDIYQAWTELEDFRFKSYSTRRLNHLLKLCLICAAAQNQNYIDTSTVTYANSILHYTESFMPKALGEFGKARNSDVSAKILDIIDKAERPLDITKDIYVKVRRDLDNPKQLSEILRNLASAGKIQSVTGGILPRKIPTTFDFPYCRVGLLQEYIEEQAKKGLPI